MDFVQARNNMVDCQVRPSDVTDLRLLAAMLELPRERFVPPAQADLAYSDFAVPLGPASPDSPARRLMRPRDIAKLIQAAEVEPDDIALVVGCASGYGAALLARLVSQVVALEQDSGLAAFAGEALRKCGIHNCLRRARVRSMPAGRRARRTTSSWSKGRSRPFLPRCRIS